MSAEISMVMDHARDCLNEAKSLERDNWYGGATNRAYYAIFSAASAILQSKDLYANTHSGLSHTFNLHFVRTSLLPPVMNNLIGQSFNLRQTVDYDFSYVATQEDAVQSIEYANKFLSYAEAYLRDQKLID